MSENKKKQEDRTRGGRPIVSLVPVALTDTQTLQDAGLSAGAVVLAARQPDQTQNGPWPVQATPRPFRRY